MARAVVQRREQQPFTRTGDLAEVLKVANPAWEKGKNPATRAFRGCVFTSTTNWATLRPALKLLSRRWRLVADWR